MSGETREEVTNERNREGIDIDISTTSPDYTLAQPSLGGVNIGASITGDCSGGHYLAIGSSLGAKAYNIDGQAKTAFDLGVSANYTYELNDRIALTASAGFGYSLYGGYGKYSNDQYGYDPETCSFGSNPRTDVYASQQAGKTDEQYHEQMEARKDNNEQVSAEVKSHSCFSENFNLGAEFQIGKQSTIDTYTGVTLTQGFGTKKPTQTSVFVGASYTGQIPNSSCYLRVDLKQPIYSTNTSQVGNKTYIPTGTLTFGIKI